MLFSQLEGWIVLMKSRLSLDLYIRLTVVGEVGCICVLNGCINGRPHLKQFSEGVMFWKEVKQ